MDQLLLTPNSIPLLAKFMLAFIVTVYVLLFVKKSKPVLWFCGYLIGYTGLDFFAFLGASTTAEWRTLAFPAQYIFSLLLTISYLQFAYSFEEKLYPNEQKIVRIGLFSVGVLALLYLIYTIVETGFGDYSHIQILLPFPLLVLVWSAVVFFRKYRSIALRETGNSYLRSAYRSFFVLSSMAVLLSLAPALRALDLIGISAFTLTFFVLNLFIFAGLTLSFINYIAQRTSLLVKLIGLTLVLFTIIIGLQGFLILPDYDGIESLNRMVIHQQVVPFVWFLLASVCIILLVFPVFYSHSVLAPLKKLLTGVDRVNAGDLNTTIPVLHYDEIGYVSSHFNQMTQSLKKANQELTQYTEKLEQRVSERTEQLNKQNKTLEEQTEKLERLHRFRTQLFMNISHELRTPITLIKGPLEKLLRTHQADREVSKQLGISLRNSKRLQQLVEQILDLNRLESDQLKLRVTKIDVAKLLNYYSVSFQSLIDYNGIAFNTSIPEHPVEVYLDPDKFEKIINNLISNAVKFTPKGQSIQLSLEEHANFIILRIRDTGKGISEEKLPHIFDPFKTSATDEIDYREGLGIGLTITKEYVKLHGGEIKAESVVGKGTLFEVTLKKGHNHVHKQQIFTNQELAVPGIIAPEPATTSEYQHLPSNTLRVPISPKEQANILLVEDNLDMATYVKNLLETEGYLVTHAENGAIALDILKDDDPDLIVSDIMMPVMDGMTFLKNIRNIDRFKDTPTVFLSARSDMEGRLESLRIGVNDYLVKPFNATELLFRIENLLEYSQMRRQASIELSDEGSVSVDQELINKLTRLIESQISNVNLTVEELAGEVAMSRRTLYREIKKASGFSAAAFVREVRLQKARQKLEAALVQSVSELAQEVGFQSGSYFSKTYYNRFGKKPISYVR